MSAIMYKNNVYGAGGASGGGGSSTLAGLSDVSLSSPTNGQVLAYDDNNDKWVNTNPTCGGIDYSTTEQDTGQKWVNGKKVYQITIEYSSGLNFTNATASTFPAASLPSGWLSNIEHFLECFATRIQTSSRGTGSFAMGAWRDGSNLKLYAAQSWSGMTHFTFRYTKVTE